MGYVVGGCNVQCTCYTEHGTYGLSCLYAEAVESMSSARSVWYRVCWSLSCEILLPAEHGRYGSMDDCGVSNAEYLVHFVHMNRLTAHREFCGVHSWQLEWHKM